MNLQNIYDIRIAEAEVSAKQLNKIEPVVDIDALARNARVPPTSTRIDRCVTVSGVQSGNAGVSAPARRNHNANGLAPWLPRSLSSRRSMKNAAIDGVC
jgi:hypothetical protein